VIGSGIGARISMHITLEVVLRRPFRGCFMWPFDVVVLGGRYFATAFLERWGAPQRKPQWMAVSNDALGGLHRLLCMNFTLFSFVAC
jgi:hypothetical protein